MLKRLVTIAVITGLAHIFTVYVLRQLGSLGPVEQIGLVGETDSLINLVIVLLAGGLVMASVRDLAMDENWQVAYVETQRARLSLSLFLAPLAIVGYISFPYFAFVASPILALNGDYMLYGRGKPVTAAGLSFVKVFIPSLAILLASNFFPEQIVVWFSVANIVVYIAVGSFISRTFGVPYWIRPSFVSLRLYLSSIATGIVALSYYFMGLGIIAFGGIVYGSTTIAVAYIAIKIYVIYKGVLRIITQSFFREMRADLICLKVDMIGTLCGLAFFLSCVLFPVTLTNFFFNQTTIDNKFWLLTTAVSGLIISPFISLTSRILIENKDKFYAIISVYGILASVGAMLIFRLFTDNVAALLSSLLLGELIITVGLIVATNLKHVAADRARFVLRSIPLLLVPVSIRYLIGDEFHALLLALIAFGIPAVYVNRRNLTISNPEKTQEL